MPFSPTYTLETSQSNYKHLCKFIVRTLLEKQYFQDVLYPPLTKLLPLCSLADGAHLYVLDCINSGRKHNTRHFWEETAWQWGQTKHLALKFQFQKDSPKFSAAVLTLAVH